MNQTITHAHENQLLDIPVSKGKKNHRRAGTQLNYELDEAHLRPHPQAPCQ